jgi:hypothetical protein
MSIRFELFYNSMSGDSKDAMIEEGEIEPMEPSKMEAEFIRKNTQQTPSAPQCPQPPIKKDVRVFS